MKMALTGWALVLAAGTGSLLQGQDTTGVPATRHGFMRPDAATRAQWAAEHRMLPRHELTLAQAAQRQADGRLALPPKADVYGNLVLNVAERNQGSCGDCWVWGSTALAETSLAAKYGIKDRLSVQFLNATMTTYQGGATFACNGGTLTKFAKWYNTQGRLVPWANANGHFQDAVVPSFLKKSLVEPATISQTPSYAFTKMTPATVVTDAMTQDESIEAIKAVLAAGQAVGFSYWVDFDAFGAFWSNAPETEIWKNTSEGGTWNDNAWGGHMVTIVGYDATDADPAKHYWIVLNSCGGPANRPGGTFRMPMRMNYQATFLDGTNTYSMYEFESLDVTLTPPAPAAPGGAITLSQTPVAGQGLTLSIQGQGAPPLRYQWRRNGTPVAGATSAQLELPILAETDNGQSFDVVVSNASGSWTAPAQVLAVSGHQLLVNPDFEQKGVGWVLSQTDGKDAWRSGYANPTSHSGGGYLFFGGNGKAQQGTFFQKVQIPAGGAVALSWWMRMTTSDSTLQAKDTLSIQVRDETGATVLKELKTYSNANVENYLWRPASADLTAFAGRTVMVGAAWSEDATLATSFRIDDMGLTALSTAPQAPQLATFAPVAGTPGTAVTLSGSGLTGATRVTFNGTDAVFQVVGDAQITTTVPVGATTGPLKVTTPAGTAQSATVFTVNAGPALPTVAMVRPAAGLPGIPVTLTGSGFTGTMSLTFNGTPATFTVVDATKITTTVPAGATSGVLRVTTPGGVATFSDFKVRSRDLTGDGQSDVLDLALIFRSWTGVGVTNAPNYNALADLDGDGDVDDDDLQLFLAAW